MSLERQIKKHILAQPQTLVLRKTPGFQDLAEKEAVELSEKMQLSTTIEDLVVRGLKFRDLPAFALMHLTSRDALWLLHETTLRKYSDFAAALKKLDLSMIFDESSKLKIDVRMQRSMYKTERELNEIVAAWLQVSPFEKGEDQSLLLEVEENRLKIFIKLDSHPLSHRKYKSEMSAVAPLAENVAACQVALTLQEWTRAERVWIPFAGSGTYAAEALLWASPTLALERDLAAKKWLCFQDPAFQYWQGQNLNRRKISQITCSDWVDDVVEGLKRNVSLWQTWDKSVEWSVQKCDFFDESPPVDSVVLLNPPLGNRLGSDSRSLYQRIGKRLNEIKCHGSIIVPSAECHQALAESIKGKRHAFTLGGSKVWIMVF